VYQWELADPAEPEFASLSQTVQAALTAFMDAVVIVDPIEYQCHPGAPSEPSKLLRTLYFGHHNEGSLHSWSTLRTTLYWWSRSSGSANET
jgi:hypothetical protein